MADLVTRVVPCTIALVALHQRNAHHVALAIIFPYSLEMTLVSPAPKDARLVLIARCVCNVCQGFTRILEVV